MLDRPWQKFYDSGVPVSIEYPDIPLFDFLTQASRRYPEHVCTVFNGQEITYLEMNRLVGRLSAALCTLGVNKGDRVGLCLPNIPQFVMSFYAILKLGGVVVAMNPQYKLRELEYLVNDSGVEILIGLDSLYDLLKTVRVDTCLRTLILTSLRDSVTLSYWENQEVMSEINDAPLSPGDWLLKNLVLSQPDDGQIMVEVSSNDAAVLQYSGGTTGAPKGAIGLHRNLVANSLMFRRWLVGLQDGQETTLMAIPMYHVYGMVLGMSVSILLGSKMVLIADPRDLKNLLQNIQTYRASFFPGVPTMYAIINQFPEVQAGKFNLRSIRACISGSAPLLKNVREQFEKLTGAQLMEGYGLSEAPTATHCNPMYGEKREGSIGLPLPDVDCRIVSLEDGETELEANEVGELLIRSPQVMSEYHNRPEDTFEVLRCGWLHTGDIARMDSDGYFYIVDRKKELIKVSGYQVWPREIEEVIASHPKVMEVCVAGIPDPIRGEVPKAWVVLRPEELATPKEIIEWCEEALVYYKAPTQVQFIDSLPRTSVGKVLRRELIRQHIENSK